MYASAQYLLSGLPVVSTPSLGGRDVFFDDRYTAIVEADSRAIKQGVEDLNSRDIPADFIRQRTLEKMKAHRQRFIKLVQNIYDAEGVKRDFNEEWDKIFFNKMLRPQSHLETIKHIC
jgi:glycosyltransferase involved in cell wall biosynthesis